MIRELPSPITCLYRSRLIVVCLSRRCLKLFGVAVDGIQLDSPLSWEAAEEACHLMGSDTHLASVTTEEHQLAVSHLASGQANVWIGLNDRSTEGMFVWSDEEPLGYSNWGVYDPSGDGDAVTLQGDQHWADNPDDNLLPYICAQKALPGEFPPSAKFPAQAMY